MQMRIILQKRILILIFLSFLLLLPMNSNIFQISSSSDLQHGEERKDPTDTISQPPVEDQYIVPQDALSPNIVSRNNVSQFNVTESITSKAPQNNMNLTRNNLTVGIPSGWNYDHHVMNISSVYQPWELVKNGNVTANTNWGFATNRPVGTSLFALRGVLNLPPIGNLETQSLGTIGAPMPKDTYGVWHQTNPKPNPDLQVQETDFISKGGIRNPIYELFNLDPQYTKLYDNPFGGTSGTADRLLSWSVGYYQAYIKAGSSHLTLGNPSIAWSQSFDLGAFRPKETLLGISWGVENLGYEQADNFSVMVRIDGQFINGKIDYFGNTYTNATEDAIEFDGYNPAETASHGIITRIYDITDLLNSNSTIHTVEFGIWFRNIDDTGDIVRVYFDTLVIQTTEEDQYKIGQFSFKYTAPPKSKNLTYWWLFATIQNNVAQEVLFLGALIDIATGYHTANLSSRYKYLFNYPNVTISLGIYLIANRYFDSQSGFSLYFDDLTLKMNYANTNLASLALQVTSNNGMTWNNVLSWRIVTQFPTSSSQLVLKFRIGNNIYNRSAMYFESSLFLTKRSIRSAYTNYRIPSLIDNQLSYIFWDVFYNNTPSLNRAWNYANFNLSLYNFTIQDLPAWDGQGKDSIDWKFLEMRNPTGGLVGSSYISRANGTTNSGNFQNLSVIYPQSYLSGNKINGTWMATLRQNNYLNSVSIRNSTAVISRVYHANETNIVVNRSIWSYEIPLNGNYNVTMYNATEKVVSGFPKLYSNYPENLTISWQAFDQGIGQYMMVAIWNDTDPITHQTLRIGVRVNTFQMWRSTKATLKIEPPWLITGQKGLFYFNYSQILNNRAITGASPYSSLFYNNTKHEWGLDWPPYVSMVESVTENITAFGNYTLKFKTIGVPPGNYTVFLKAAKPFFDPQYLFSIIRINGTAVSVSILYGAFNVTNVISLYPYNIPAVNDTHSSWIVINVTDSNGTLTGGIITGRYNGSSTIVEGYDVFGRTRDLADKGLYNITLNTMGLNATKPYRQDISNYSLTITIAIEAHSPFSFNITVAVKPLPTQIIALPAPAIFEANSFDFFASFRNILNPTIPLPLAQADMNWYLITSMNIVVATGTFTSVMPGSDVYRAFISLDTESWYIDPGSYTFKVNATQLNCFLAEWSQSLEIIEKMETQLNIQINDVVRIGQSVNIIVNLSNLAGNPLSNEDLEIKLTYQDTDTFTVFETTDNQGIATYSQIVPFSYANSQLTVNVTYEGNSTVKGCTTEISRLVKGALLVNLTLGAFIELGYARVGYPIEITGNISIEERSQYSGIFVTLGAWYDGKRTEPIFIQEIFCNIDGTFEYLLAIIEEGHDNITFFVDYASTQTTEYKSFNFTLDITPKWEVSIELGELPQTIRLGQIVSFNLLGNLTDPACSENLTGEKLNFQYIFTGGISGFYEVFFDINNSIEFEYELPLNIGNQLNLSIHFAGTNRIGTFSKIFSLTILPQKTTEIYYLGSTSIQSFAGNNTFSVKLLDDSQTPVNGQLLYFIIRDENEDIVGNYSAITNDGGIALVSILFEKEGEYTVDVIFPTHGIYASSSLSQSGSGIIYNVRIVTYGILLLDYLPYILGIIASIIALGLVFQRTVIRPRQIRERNALLEIHRKFADIENVQYILIIHKEASVSVFSHAFTEIPIEENLVSGFLTAINAFGKEIGRKVTQESGPHAAGSKTQIVGSGLQELAYQQFKIAVFEGKYVRTAVLMLKSSSPSLREKIERFNISFEKEYHKILEYWNGQVPDPAPIILLVERVLHADLLYPHNLVMSRVPLYQKKVGKKSLKGMILKEAQSNQFNNTFKVREMINAMAAYGRRDVDTFYAIDDLRREQILFAINPRTQYLILQFRPYITPLSTGAREVLKALHMKSLEPQVVAKQLHLKDTDSVINELRKMQLIHEIGLSEIGEIVAMLLKLIPDI